MMFCASCPPLTRRLLPEEGGGTTLIYSQPSHLAPLAAHSLHPSPLRQVQGGDALLRLLLNATGGGTGRRVLSGGGPEEEMGASGALMGDCREIGDAFVGVWWPLEAYTSGYFPGDPGSDANSPTLSTPPLPSPPLP